MAEERICICKLEGNATESVCGGSISRTEAIEKMADAIDKLGLDIDAIDSYICAEAALNALLGGK